MASLHSSNIQNTALRKTESQHYERPRTEHYETEGQHYERPRTEHYETEELNFERRKTSTTIGGSAALR